MITTAQGDRALQDLLMPTIMKTIQNTIEAVAEEKAIEFKQKLIRDMRKAIGEVETQWVEDVGMPKLEIHLNIKSNGVPA